MNGVDIHFKESDLASWLELNNAGYKCKGLFQYKTETELSDDESNSDVGEVEVLSKDDVQEYLRTKAVIEVVGPSTKFEQNDSRTIMRMVYGAITRNIIPKHNI